jgi:hypothetical protein
MINSRVRPASGASAQWWYDRVAEDQEDVASLRFTRVLSYRPDKSVAEEDSPRRSRRWEWWFRVRDACRG